MQALYTLNPNPKTLNPKTLNSKPFSNVCEWHGCGRHRMLNDLKAAEVSQKGGNEVCQDWRCANHATLGV